MKCLLQDATTYPDKNNGKVNKNVPKFLHIYVMLLKKKDKILLKKKKKTLLSILGFPVVCQPSFSFIKYDKHLLTLYKYLAYFVA